MREFFRGWRRKVGCIALAVAIPIGLLLVRGFSIADRVWFGLGETQHLICSIDGRILWFSWHSAHQYQFSQFASTGVTDAVSRERFWQGFHGVFRVSTRWELPLWYLLLPMTLLSVILLLWPRRKPKT